MPTDLEGLSDAYELAEVAFLTALREGRAREELGAAARAVAEAADAFNVEAYRKYHANEEDAWDSLDHLTERTEVLAELWEDIASAYSA